MRWTDIVYEKKNAVALATLNRPERLNSLRRTTLRELRGVIDEFETDRTVRVLILSGEGRSFSAGEDLKELSAQMEEGSSMARAREHVLELQDLTRRLVRSSKPVIAAVNGLAVGLGAELAIACDVRIASERASFAFREVQRGLFETAGVMYLLPALVGMGRAMQWFLTGETIGAQRALAAGLVTEVVAAEKLLDSALACARVIIENAPISVRLVKQVLRRAYDLDLESVFHLEMDGVLECFASEDFREGVRSFVEKRPPSFKGR